MGRYETEQRRQLLKYMEGNADKQYSAEELAEILAGGEDKAPGKSTVYRLVSQLTEEGILRRFPKSEGRGWTYQYHQGSDCSGHLHLKCEKCGALVHLECGMSEELLAHIEEEHGFAVDNGKTVLYGICAACRSADGQKCRAGQCRCHAHG